MEIILIADPRILVMPVQDIGEPLIDIKNFSQIFLSSSTYQKATSYTKVRQSVANKLLEATKYLPFGTHFLLEEGHRTLAVQKEIFDEYYQKLKNSNIDWDADTLFKATIQYVAPPQKNAPHSTGAAIDITLANVQGEKLDMGTPMNETPDQNHNASFTHAPNISAEAKANRQLLINALTKVGFVNYPTEWWHWSYGDRYWAYHKNMPHAIFSSIES